MSVLSNAHTHAHRRSNELRAHLWICSTLWWPSLGSHHRVSLLSTYWVSVPIIIFAPHCPFSFPSPPPAVSLEAVLDESGPCDEQIRTLCLALLEVELHRPPMSPASSPGRRSIATSPFPAGSPGRTTGHSPMTLSPFSTPTGRSRGAYTHEEDGEEDIEEDDSIPSSTPLRLSAQSRFELDIFFRPLPCIFSPPCWGHFFVSGRLAMWLFPVPIWIRGLLMDPPPHHAGACSRNCLGLEKIHHQEVWCCSLVV